VALTERSFSPEDRAGSVRADDCGVNDRQQIQESPVQPLVDVSDLIISYDAAARPAVNSINFHVRPGEVLGLLGGNGAGKTSTLRALAGVTPSTSGRILIDGLDLSQTTQAEKARALVGYCPDVSGVIRQATVTEHIALALAFRDNAPSWPAALTLAEKFGLGQVLDREVLGFSHGMSRRLSVLMATLTAEKVLILDEPFDGVDPLGVEATRDVIQSAKDAGLAVIVSTHLLSLLTSVADTVAIMVAGQILEQRPSADYSTPEGAAHYTALLSGHRR
jgi:ABC-2 type transport system ATP-binding protein